MTDNEMLFMEAALEASGGKDGNFDFECPLCGGYSIGCLKSRFELIMGTCPKCLTAIREKVIINKGA